ncbi:calnexin [Leucoraja erinacea]|uniref:calnexin n=1 Tax=Leucoraja erinaceus TaxID=7782 RepID=UPI00245524B2|nr:calnexin [Leucoraja erinacea]
MELKLWLVLVLVFGAAVIRAEDEDDLVEDEDDESPVESESEPSTPPAPKVTYKAPVPIGRAHFAESFDKGTLEGWVRSKAKKEDTDEDIAKYDGKWEVEEMKDTKLEGDKGLVLKTRAKHHAIASSLDHPFIFDDKPLFLQYEVNFQNGIECGGAYIKLLTKTKDMILEKFYDKTPYTIMFGPDKCGEDYKLHFIIRHKNPKTGEVEEKHAKRPDVDLKSYYTDKKTHLYTLVVNPDNSFQVLIDQTVVNSGNLLQDMTPAINPPKEIEDPDDQKPEDWDERSKISDPDAVKPDDWDEDAPAKIPDDGAVKPEGWLDDEPEYIADPDAEKPEDWDEEMDGEWEAPQVANSKCDSAPGCGAWKLPMIDNPDYKGKWKALMIDNPDYQGAWKPKKIANPNYFEDLHPFKMATFSAVGLELWSMTSDIFFDNFIICSDKAVVDQWAYDSWGLKKSAEGSAESGVVGQLMSAAEERPWLWVVYILIIALPVFLVIVFCCTGKKDTAAEYKKTDAPQPDVKDEEGEEKEEQKEAEEKNEADDEKMTEEKQKSDMEEAPGNASQEEEEEDDDDDEDEEEEEEEKKVTREKPSAEQTDEKVDSANLEPQND